jgi:hypothetical protein
MAVSGWWGMLLGKRWWGNAGGRVGDWRGFSLGMMPWCGFALVERVASGKRKWEDTWYQW